MRPISLPRLLLLACISKALQTLGMHDLVMGLGLGPSSLNLTAASYRKWQRRMQSTEAAVLCSGSVMLPLR